MRIEHNWVYDVILIGSYAASMWYAPSEIMSLFWIFLAILWMGTRLLYQIEDAAVKVLAKLEQLKISN
jgi:hypothetical protein